MLRKVIEHAFLYVFVFVNCCQLYLYDFIKLAGHHLYRQRKKERKKRIYVRNTMPRLSETERTFACWYDICVIRAFNVQQAIYKLLDQFQTTG